MIFVIDDDKVMAECIAKAAKTESFIFTNGIEAMAKIAEQVLPSLIFLDILLDGPDGFTFLNELVSYSDTVKIPIVVVTSLDLDRESLKEYNVVGVLNKDTMKPEEILAYVEKYK